MLAPLAALLGCLVQSSAPSIPQLSVSGGSGGQPVVYQLSGTLTIVGIPEILAIDSVLLGTPIELGTLGPLYLGAGPVLVLHPGDGSHQWTFTVPPDPLLDGKTFHAQAFGFTFDFATFEGKFRLSNPASVTLSVPLGNKARFAYVANSGDDTLSIYAVDASNGMLRHAGWVHAGAGTAPSAVEVTRDGRYAFSTAFAKNQIQAWEADAQTGQLQLIESEPSVGSGPGALAVHPSGNFLYVATASGSIAQFSINRGSGQLSPLSPAVLVLGATPTSLALSTAGNYLYASTGGTGTVRVLAVNPTTGQLSQVQSAPAGTGTARVALSPDGTRAYAANTDSDDLSGWTVNPTTGQLTAVPGSPFHVPTGDDGPVSVLVGPEGTEVYATNALSSSISQFGIGPGGALAPLAPASIPTGNGPVAIAIESTGAWAWTACVGSNELRLYARDSFGQLTGTAPHAVRARTAPRSIALLLGAAPVAFAADALYAANNVDDDISQFQLTDFGPTGLVPPFLGSGDGPNWITVHPFLDFAYATNFTSSPSNSITVYPIGSGGALGPGAPTDMAPASWSFHIDPSGRHGFLVNTTTGVTTLAIHPLTGALTPGPTLIAGTIPRAGAVHPCGKYFYLPNQFDDSISMYWAAAATGALTPLGAGSIGTGTGTSPTAVIVDPTGRFAYAAAQGANDGVACFSINPNSGALAPLSIPLVPAGVDTFDLVAHPGGRVLYAANHGSNSVSYFLIGTNPLGPGEIGSLFLLGTQPTGGPPRALCIDPAGEYLYVSLEQPGGKVETYSLDAAGTPTPLDIDATGNSTRGIGLRVR